MVELVVELLELVGEDTLAGEEQSFGHFAEDEAEGVGGHGEERRAVQSGGEDFGEIGVGDGLRRDDIEGAGDVGVFDRETKDGDYVVEGDPA